MGREHFFQRPREQSPTGRRKPAVTQRLQSRRRRAVGHRLEVEFLFQEASRQRFHFTQSNIALWNADSLAVAEMAESKGKQSRRGRRDPNRPQLIQGQLHPRPLADRLIRRACWATRSSTAFNTDEEHRQRRRGRGAPRTHRCRQGQRSLPRRGRGRNGDDTAAASDHRAVPVADGRRTVPVPAAVAFGRTVADGRRMRFAIFAARSHARVENIGTTIPSAIQATIRLLVPSAAGPGPGPATLIRHPAHIDDGQSG